MRVRRSIYLAALLIVGVNGSALAVNRVAVDSKTVSPGETGVTVGVYVENDLDLRSIVLVLELRELTPGAYIQDVFNLTPSGRVGASRLMQFPTYHESGLPGTNNCSGPTSHSFEPDVPHDYVSPDCAIWNGIVFPGQEVFHPGSDPPGSPSFVLQFNVTGTPGDFIIDTCCYKPANHLEFGDVNFAPYQPEFVPGVITIESQGVPPVAVCQSLSLVADENCEATGSIDDGSYDPDGGSVTLVQDPAGPYAPGETLVKLYVTDDEGDADTCEAIVTVSDNTPPSVSCPSDILVANDPGACGAVVSFGPSANDNCPGVTMTSEPGSGSFFPIGVTEVRVIATDQTGDADTCTFNVTVEDTEPPVAECPVDMFVQASPGAIDAVVEYSSSVTDNCPGSVVTCTPPSGSVFPAGATTVRCVATDAFDNADTCEFLVTVEVVCYCPSQSDFDGDGFLTALDLNVMIEVLFANHSDMQDPECPLLRSDFDCDGFPTAIDLDGLINHLFANGTAPCDPCTP